jgi:hypothetical protein
LFLLLRHRRKPVDRQRRKQGRLTTPVPAINVAVVVVSVDAPLVGVEV